MLARGQMGLAEEAPQHHPWRQDSSVSTYHQFRAGRRASRPQSHGSDEHYHDLLVNGGSHRPEGWQKWLHHGCSTTEVEATDPSAEYRDATGDRLLEAEHDQLGKGADWGQAPKVLAGGLTKAWIVWPWPPSCNFKRWTSQRHGYALKLSRASGDTRRVVCAFAWRALISLYGVRWRNGVVLVQYSGIRNSYLTFPNRSTKIKDSMFGSTRAAARHGCIRHMPHVGSSPASWTNAPRSILWCDWHGLWLWLWQLQLWAMLVKRFDGEDESVLEKLLAKHLLMVVSHE
jgi:hypothetical protein